MIRIVAAVILIVGTGILHGSWTNRWRPSGEAMKLAARLESVPMDIGAWKGTAVDVPTVDRQSAGGDACLARQYSDPNRGVTLLVVFLAGLPARISSHPPEACFPAAGYAMRPTVTLGMPYGRDNRRAEFQTTLAMHEGPPPSAVRIFWSWTAGQRWSAPENPRWKFAHEAVLCKLYVIRETTGAVADPAGDPCVSFLNIFLPELDRRLFSLAG